MARGAPCRTVGKTRRRGAPPSVTGGMTLSKLSDSPCDTAVSARTVTVLTFRVVSPAPEATDRGTWTNPYGKDSTVKMLLAGIDWELDGSWTA